MLRAAGHRVRVAVDWKGERCDALLALHARRSHASIARYRERHPDAPLIVALTGTDLYRDLPASADARRSLELADRIIVLQDAALKEVDAPTRRKTRVVYQSADPRLRHAPAAGPFRVAVVGHLREEKDPLRTVAALHRLPGEEIVLIQLGAALDPLLGREARRWMAREPRYRWLGSVTHAQALGWIARSHLLVVSSVMEGGANVIAEAARIGTPVLATRVSGNIGMLGSGYPGFFPLFDDARLATLLKHCARDARFLVNLKRSIRQRRPLFAPAAERRSLAAVVADALARRA